MCTAHPYKARLHTTDLAGARIGAGPMGLSDARWTIYRGGMCRNIQQLRGAQPAATSDEVRDAALQYVRKISGYRAPSQANAEAFDAAVDDIAAVTERLLDELVVGPGSRVPELLQRRRQATSA